MNKERIFSLVGDKISEFSSGTYDDIDAVNGAALVLRSQIGILSDAGAMSESMNSIYLRDVQQIQDRLVNSIKFKNDTTSSRDSVGAISDIDLESEYPFLYAFIEENCLLKLCEACRYDAYVLRDWNDEVHRSSLGEIVSTKFSKAYEESKHDSKALLEFAKEYSSFYLPKPEAMTMINSKLSMKEWKEKLKKVTNSSSASSDNENAVSMSLENENIIDI